MSGICGIVYHDDRRVEHGEIARLLEPLARRGPDGSHVTLDANTGFGHALLATTPEALNTRLPLRHVGTGCIITADARLDNYDELSQSLGVPIATSDAELILHAWLKWDHACLERLRGDFAFAIWDPREQALFCARDQIGMRQLIWHHQPGKLFTFATETQALLHHPLVPLKLHEGRIGDYIENLEAHDLTSTFFAGLNKLPPAHALTLVHGSLRVWRYWEAEPQEPLHLATDAAYAEAFLDVFTRAVDTRLRSSGPVGATLSGGMDSGAVAAVAANLLNHAGKAPLQTYSALRSKGACVESDAIRAAMNIAHIVPTPVTLEEFARDNAEVMTLTKAMGEPFDGQMALLRAVYLAAHQAGVKVMLDGVGGDTTLGSEPMVARLLRNGKLLSALREARGEGRFWGNAADTWRDHARAAMRTIAPRRWIEARQARYSERKLDLAATISPLDPAFAARIAMPQRRRENARRIAAPADFAERRIQRILHPYVVVARERYDRTASQLAIEPRDPFLDLRVIEFCLSLPQEQLQSGGWPKIILRRAMQGLLPDEVRWRPGKEHLGGQFNIALWHQASPCDFTGIESYLNAKATSQARLAAGNNEAIALAIHLRYLEAWVNCVKQCK